jgi:hypothetical protein
LEGRATLARFVELAGSLDFELLGHREVTPEPAELAI